MLSLLGMSLVGGNLLLPLPLLGNPPLLGKCPVLVGSVHGWGLRLLPFSLPFLLLLLGGQFPLL